MHIIKKPLKSEKELLLRSEKIEGLTIGQLANILNLNIPVEPVKRKGFIGQVVEYALGASAKNQSLPDFYELDIELKTIPVNHLGKSQESTFITSIPLLKICHEVWKTSTCFAKLKRILWIPIEADKSIAFTKRRIGHGILWSPSKEEEEILKCDWQLLTSMIVMGKLEQITSCLGEFLQIRPKGANSKSLCYAYDEHGAKILTLPRGFYLRSSFTNKILNAC